jgi:DnaJ-class molecular chaperone
MEYRDYYATLGVPRNASQADIKRAFRKLARESHPDKHQGDKKAEQRFKEINEANEVLSDPEKRKRYDVLGANWDRVGDAGPFASGFGGFSSSGTGPGGIRYEFRSSGDAAGFSDFFRTFFAGAAAGATSRGRADEPSIDDILASLGVASAAASTRRGGSSAGARRAPVEAEAELSLEEAFHGATRLVQIDGKRLEIQIPRGVTNGSRVRLAGQGGDGRDLVVVTKIRPHPVFGRRGDDLEREVAVTLEEALLGGEVPVGTLSGRVLLTIPPGTQSGRAIRLAGQGMPRLSGKGRGDLIVRPRVVLPTSMSDEAKSAARAFLDLVDQPDPRAAPPSRRPATATAGKS